MRLFTEKSLCLGLLLLGSGLVGALPIRDDVARLEPPSQLVEALKICEAKHAEIFETLERRLFGAFNSTPSEIEGLTTLKSALRIGCARRHLSANRTQTQVDALMADVQTGAEWSGAWDYTSKVLSCLAGKTEESEALSLLQGSTKFAIPSYVESFMNSVLGELIGTLPAMFYEKAQCILYTSPPAADTVSPRSAYAGSSWETVQRAIRFSLLAYHEPATINYLFSGCKTGKVASPMPSREPTTCGPSTEAVRALRYHNYYSIGAVQDRCEEWWGGYTLERFFNKDQVSGLDQGTQGLVAKHSDGKTVWVAFRGSENPVSFDPFHVQDWIKDLTFNVQDWPYKAGAGKVHTGFLDQYKQAREALADPLLTVLKRLYDAGYRNFYFTGHSLGGALAQIASLDAALSGGMPLARTEMITVAAPEVGDKALAETHKAKVGFATRVVFNTDVVTCGFSGLPSLFAPLIKAANLAAGNGFINPYTDNAIGKLLYWSVKENKWRGTRDYECFSSDWLSSIAPLAGAIDHACDGYIGKSFVSPTW